MERVASRSPTQQVGGASVLMARDVCLKLSYGGYLLSLTSYRFKSRKNWLKPGILGSFQLVGTHAGQYELLISSNQE